MAYDVAMVVKVGRFDVDPVPMAKARRRLTEIVDAARDRDESTVLTEYNRPRAVVVSVGFFNAAVRLDEFARVLQERNPALFNEILQGLQPAQVPLKMEEA